MSKISRYCIAIFLSIFIEQLFLNNHTIFMQVEAALLCMVATQEQTLYSAEGERSARGVCVCVGGGGEETLYIGMHIPEYIFIQPVK